MSTSRRGEYGFDAPLAPILFSLLALAALFLCASYVRVERTVFAAVWGGNALFFALSTASFVYTTRRGKFRVWRRILDDLHLRGDERLLDMGCGRGAVLLLAAERLPKGRAVGVDLWSSKDQSGNSQAAALSNAEREGVRERVEVHTADMRSLPFADASFDVVVSSLAIHNIPDREGRAKAVAELWRVLKPGGEARVADIRFARDYAEALTALGAAVTRKGLGWRFWYGGPHAATTLVSTRKEGAPR